MVFIPRTTAELKAGVTLWLGDATATAGATVPNAQGTGTYGDINTWDTSSITNMSNMFKDTYFNDNISGWDVSNVTTMEGMFWNTPEYNNGGVSLSAWDTGNVRSMRKMFGRAIKFSHPIGNWDVSMVTNMGSMFSEINSFNHDISGWDVSRVTNMDGMFSNNHSFNQNITVWILHANVNLNNMFMSSGGMDSQYASNPYFGVTPDRLFFTGPLPPPTITVIGDVSITMLQSNTASYTDSGASAVDFEGINLNAQVQVSGDVVDLSTLGSYTITYSVTDSNGETSTASRTVTVAPHPTCFPAGTPVQTDQGVTAIDQLIPGEHTLRGKSIIAITQTRPLQTHLICFEKDSIGKNVPSQQTLCSKEHKVLYQGEMIKARDLADMCKNVKKVPYNGETLYNVLLKQHDKMVINNLICETLHPENITAKIYNMKNGSEKRKIMSVFDKIMNRNNRTVRTIGA